MRSSSTSPTPLELTAETTVLPPVAGGDPSGKSVARISSQALLCGANEVEIEHKGALYRLRQTSLGKLILTK